MTSEFVYVVDVKKNHRCFEGHFPGFSVFPAVAQIALLQQAVSAYHKKDCEVTGLPMTKFLHPIIPETRLSIELTAREPNHMSFIIVSGQQTFAKGKLTYRMSV